MKRIAAGMLLATLGGARVGADGAGRSGDGELTMPYKLFYSFQTGEVETNQLTIDQGGVVTASIAHSVPGSVVRTIGRYYLTAGPADPDLLAIGKQIADDGLASGQPQTTSARYGGRYALFIIEVDGRETKHVVDATEPIPGALGTLSEKLTALMARVGLKAPQRAVSIHLELDPTAAAPGDRMRITLDVRNAGPFRTQIRNFAGFRRGGADSIKINFWTPPEHAGEAPEFAWTLDLAGNEWHVAERKTVRPKDAYLTLEGPDSLRAWTEIRLPKTDPGPLLADFAYYAHIESEAEQTNDDLVCGFYRADPVNLTISPRPAR
jgi:hypothetical protein